MIALSPRNHAQHWIPILTPQTTRPVCPYPDNLVKPNGFSIYRLDRDRVITQKEDGGGVCFIVNDKWCTNIKVTSTLCTKNLECVTIKCRPFYLPREFTSITLTGVYIHPRADTTDALNDLSNIISKAENSEPDTVSIVLGDFNQANLRQTLPNYKQIVTCPTRKDKTLDHCYVKVKPSYKSFERAALGNSDHSSVLLIPTYKQQSKQAKPVEMTVQCWTQSAVETLKNCLDITEWSVFSIHQDNIDTYTSVVCSYISFCVDQCIPTKTITVYNNNKVWFNRNIKDKLYKKDQAYKNKIDKPEDYKKAKKELTNAIKEQKIAYKDKIEDNFSSKDSKKLWSHISNITQYKGPQRTVDDGDATLPDRLNDFYSRFDKDNDTTPAYTPVQDDAPPPFVITKRK